MHGRPKRFNGSWYTSVFVHYYPKDTWDKSTIELENHYAIPPSWDRKLQPADMTEQQAANYTELEMLGTTFNEPGCPNGWCRTQNTIQWGGPGQEGYWIAPTGDRYPFHPERRLTNHDDGTSNTAEL